MRQSHFRWPPSGLFDGNVRTRRTATGPARTTAPPSGGGAAPVKSARTSDQPPLEVGLQRQLRAGVPVTVYRGPSTPGTREPLRDQVVASVNATHRHGGQRSPIGIGPLSLDHPPAPRQQPDQCDTRGFARSKIAPGIRPPPVLALRAIGNFGRSDLGAPRPLAAAPDRVAVVDRGRKAKGGGSEGDGDRERARGVMDWLGHGTTPARPVPL